MGKPSRRCDPRHRGNRLCGTGSFYLVPHASPKNTYDGRSVFCGTHGVATWMALLAAFSPSAPNRARFAYSGASELIHRVSPAVLVGRRTAIGCSHSPSIGSTESDRVRTNACY